MCTLFSTQVLPGAVDSDPEGVATALVGLAAVAGGTFLAAGWMHARELDAASASSAQGEEEEEAEAEECAGLLSGAGDGEEPY